MPLTMKKPNPALLTSEHEIEMDGSGGSTLRVKVSGCTEIINNLVELELQRYLSEHGPSLEVRYGYVETYRKKITSRHTYSRGIVGNYNLPPPVCSRVVVGVDFIFPKQLWSFHPRGFMILCFPNNFCLVTAVNSSDDYSIELWELLEDARIFLVGLKSWSSRSYRRCGFLEDMVSDLSQLVARVRKMPAVYGSKNLAKVAAKVGVEYDHTVADSARRVKVGVKRYWDDLVFSDEEVKAVIYNAFLSCKIAQMMISEMPAS